MSFNAIHLVRVASLDGVEAVEHVALHHNQLSDAVEHDGVTQSHKVNPSAAAFATGYSAVFVTDVANLCACFVEQLGRERTATHACAVSLENAKHLANLVGGNAKARAGSGADGVRRSYERIRTEVNVEHAALCAFAQYALAFSKEFVYNVFAVDNFELLDIFDAFKPLFFEFLNIHLKAQSAEQAQVALLGCGIFLGKVAINVAQTQSVAANLVGVSGANAFAGGANLGSALQRLVGCIQLAVGGQNQVYLL